MAEQVAKIKKKQWLMILAPKMFDNVPLGETLVFDPGAMMGKTLSYSLMNLINDNKKQNISLQFKVTEVEGDHAKTAVIGYKIMPSSIKRFVRRNSEKVDLSFPCDTSDNVLVRIKLLFVTKNTVKGSIAAKLRHNSVSFVIKTIKKMTYEELIDSLITRKLHEMIKESLNPIFPLKICEIRYAGIEEREKTQEVKIESAKQ